MFSYLRQWENSFTWGHSWREEGFGVWVGGFIGCGQYSNSVLIYFLQCWWLDRVEVKQIKVTSGGSKSLLCGSNVERWSRIHVVWCNLFFFSCVYVPVTLPSECFVVAGSAVSGCHWFHRLLTVTDCLVFPQLTNLPLISGTKHPLGDFVKASGCKKYPVFVGFKEIMAFVYDLSCSSGSLQEQKTPRMEQKIPF